MWADSWTNPIRFGFLQMPGRTGEKVAQDRRVGEKCVVSGNT